MHLFGTPLRALLLVVIGNVSITFAEDTARWSMDSSSPNTLLVGKTPAYRDGVEGHCSAFDGNTVLELDGASGLPDSKHFTLVVWVNPHTLNRNQQAIAAKNRYSLGEREWTLMLDTDRRFRLYVREEGWRTISGPDARPGSWHQLIFVRNANEITFYVDGEKQGELSINALATTNAPVTVGGVNDNGNLRQTLVGAIDEVQLLPKSLTEADVKQFYRPVTSKHALPEPPQLETLWDESEALPTASNLTPADDVKFHVIQTWNEPVDGYRFLHGVALQFHRGRLFASFGHNQGDENTVTEEAHYRISDDQGMSWGPLHIIDHGEEENLAVSHGVFLSEGNSLWAFHGSYYGRMEDIHTRAYRYDENSDQWTPLGRVIGEGFWPMNQPVRMEDGNWIMPGLLGKRYDSNQAFPAAVAISHGNHFEKWDLVRIPVDKNIHQMWGESSLWVSGENVFNVSRFGDDAKALLATSDDYGRTWSPSKISNLPMATSKPAAGVLSTGQRYLVCTTAAENGGRRMPLTIAISRPGENVFSKVLVLRRAMQPNAPGESAKRLSLSYPYAIEHDGHLYVGYSNNGGRSANLNSAEMAVVPIESLRTD
ncbi:LamG-like jellyroll fold domain-containing protein [Rhodopirellula halodulae]|uniref:LamG-like jellyroll fold domain-containing protein n=1 Tax=Rhodopirellula halodulae TaxID=2894198 RepID=UPI001E63EA02|nr:LamG-like jellyroll fold domain-containing protein [Rhodopirellula sp. JC737]MCC9656179.1 exo-alpha-sialidase [Rhodopirellula sp. JC737]